MFKIFQLSLSDSALVLSFLKSPTTGILTILLQNGISVTSSLQFIGLIFLNTLILTTGFRIREKILRKMGPPARFASASFLPEVAFLFF